MSRGADRSTQQLGSPGQGVGQDGREDGRFSMPRRQGAAADQGSTGEGLRTSAQGCACCDAIAALTARLDKLADALIVQAGAIHGLADAIATPIDDDRTEEETHDSAERFMDGTPIG